jgi:hypothetical protein
MLYIEERWLGEGGVQCRIKRLENAHTYRVCATYQTEKCTAEIRAVTPEVKTWKSHVNATISHVRSRSGRLAPVGSLTWLTDLGYMTTIDLAAP